MGDGVVETLAPGVLDQRHRAGAARLQALVEALLVDRERLDLLAPAGRARLAVEPVLEVVDQERLDVRGVAVDLLVVGLAPERHQRPGHDVDEAPDELPERGRLPLGGELAGDPGGHLGDAREAPDRVVASRELRVPEVEEEELAGAPGPLRLRVDAAQEIDVALGVEHDDDLAAADVLGEQQLRQPRLADPRGPQHQGVADAVGEIHPDVGLGELDAVEGGIAADRRGIRRRVAEQARKAGEAPRPQQVALLGETRLVQALGVALVPAEPPAEEETRGGPRDLVGAHDVAALAAQVGAIAQDLPARDPAPERVASEDAGESPPHRGWQQEGRGARAHQGGAEHRHGGRAQLVGGAQQRFERIGHQAPSPAAGTRTSSGLTGGAGATNRPGSGMTTPESRPTARSARSTW